MQDLNTLMSSDLVMAYVNKSVKDIFTYVGLNLFRAGLPAEVKHVTVQQDQNSTLNEAFKLTRPQMRIEGEQQVAAVNAVQNLEAETEVAAFHRSTVWDIMLV